MILGVSLAYAALAAGLHVFSEYFAISAGGSTLPLSVTPFVFLPVLAIPFLVMGSLVALFFRRTRLDASALLVGGLIITGASVLAFRVGGDIRMDGFRRLGMRATPLVEAINSYVEIRGAPPESLRALVPDYLPRLPRTGVAAYPDFKYSSGEDARQRYGQPWALSVFCPSGMMNWDQFLYFPDGNYPEHGFGGTLERLGDWAYVHE